MIQRDIYYELNNYGLLTLQTAQIKVNCMVKRTLASAFDARDKSAIIWSEALLGGLARFISLAKYGLEKRRLLKVMLLAASIVYTCHLQCVY